VQQQTIAHAITLSGIVMQIPTTLAVRSLRVLTLDSKATLAHRTKTAMAERRKFSALLKMLRAGLI
jgi:hypothetical protein